MTISRCSLWITAFLLVEAAEAGTPLHFHHLEDEHGLPDPRISAITQDTRGFIWIGTDSGLARYDGTKVKVFLPASGDHDQNVIGALAAADDGDLWVGTHDRGLFHYDAALERFIPHGQAKGLQNRAVTSLFLENVSRGGRLWIGTHSGLARYDPESGELQIFTAGNNDEGGLLDDQISALAATRYGLWVGTELGGLYLLDRESERFRHFGHDPDNPNSLGSDSVTGLTAGGDGIWVTTLGAGFSYLADPDVGTFQRYGMQDFGHEDHAAEFTALLEDRAGILWAGTDHGLARIDKTTGRIVQVYHRHEADPLSLAGDVVWTLFEDRAGVLWIGTENAGVSRANLAPIHGPESRSWPGGTGFRHYRETNGLSHAVVTDMDQGEDGSYWITTRGGGLNLFNPESGSLRRFTYRPDRKDSPVTNHLETVLVTFDGSVLVGSDRGVSRYNADGSFDHMPGERVRVLLQAGDGAIWAGARRGVFTLNPSTGRFQPVTYNKIESGYPVSRVQALFQDRDGRIWIGSENQGMNRYDPATGNLIADQQLGGGRVNDFYQDKRGILWAATGKGLFQFDGQVFKPLTHHFLPPGKPVLSITGDHNGELWAAGVNRLTRFDPVRQQFTVYDTADGLQNGDFMPGAALTGADGDLIFGGVCGFNHFRPDWITRDPVAPPPVLTCLYLDEKEVTVNDAQSPLDACITHTETVRLKHFQNHLSVHIAALHFAAPEKNRFRYQLKGSSDQWFSNETGVLDFRGLKPGSYALNVRAANKDGRWSQEAATLRIDIAPPLWQRWWAWSIYIIITALSVTAYIRRQRRKYQEEHELNERLQQLDRLKDEFLANTSHELRTPLNGIIGLAESLIEGAAGPVSGNVAMHLRILADSGRRLGNLVNDLLDFSRLKNHKLQLHLKVVDLFTVSEVVLTLIRPMVQKPGLKLINKVPRNLPAVHADENRLQQMLYNLVGNAIKFTDRGSVTVSAGVMADWIEISVSDTGMGIPKEKHEQIFRGFEQLDGSSTRDTGGTGLGLAITRQLVHLHGGRIDVDSEPGKGSTFSITLPIAGGKVKEAEVLPEALDREERKPDLPPPANISAPSRKQPGSVSGRVLIVDDEPVNRLVLSNYLVLHGYEVVEACSGQEVLDMMVAGEPFDMVLLDVMMPGLSGYKVCEALRRTYPVGDLPIIFLTARQQPEDLTAAFECGGDDFLNKPVHKDELVQRVRHHLELMAAHRDLKKLNNTLEEQVRERSQAMILQEKLASLGILTAGVAHEINNPNNYISGAVGNLNLGLKDFWGTLLQLASGENEAVSLLERKIDPLWESLDTIRQGSERIKGIVGDLRMFSRMNEAETKTVLLSENLRAAARLIMPGYSDRIDVAYDFHDDLRTYCKPADMNQVFANLILNACQAVEGKGAIRLITRKLEERAIIEVQDTGKGIPEIMRDRIFEPFFTTKEVGLSTGLGLWISYQIVDEHNGKIELESTPGKGSTFRVILPMKTS
ncbi:MAG: ATP-binding protein [Acidobacteriota bacterium]|nr:ATP-binding protein [Acidobacteriota bacterium]